MAGPLAGAYFAKTSNISSGGWGERPAFYALALALANIILVTLFIPETLEKVRMRYVCFLCLFIGSRCIVDFIRVLYDCRFGVVVSTAHY